jgi:methionyl-tRNA formyltransferase
VLRPQDLRHGSYFGRRTRADGAINWQLGVGAVHNLVRAVAPPYPGAYALAAGLPLRVLRTLPADAPRAARAELRLVDGEVQAVCADGALRLLEFELDGQVRDAEAFRARFGPKALPLADGQRNLQEAAGN